MASNRLHTIRIDKLLWYLRWAKTRSLAQDVVSMGHIRRNGSRIERCSASVAVGDILVLPPISWPGREGGSGVRVIEILSLPQRRGPPCEAQSHYRAFDETLDEMGVLPIAASPTEFANQGNAHP